MKRLGKNYEEANAYTDSERLPAGGYVLKIEDVKYEAGQEGKSDVIIFRFDIAEGDYTGFFRKNFEENIQEDKKWRGTYRLYVPKDDGSEQDSWTMKRFKTVMNAFEDSNREYHWNWDEMTLKGKLVGALFNDKEYSFKGRHGFFTNCHSLIPAERIRKGNFKIPEPTMLKMGLDLPQDSSGFMNIPDGTEEAIPF